MRRFITLLSTSCLLTVAAPVAAQEHTPSLSDTAADARPQRDRPGRGAERVQRLSADEATAAWTAQAAGVATRLQLDDAATAALVEAYVGARTAHREALEARRAERADGERGERRRGTRGPDPATVEARDDLRAALGSHLETEAVDTAMQSLGRFDRRWDMMVHAIAGFELDAARRDAALRTVQQYVESIGALDGREPRASREARREALDRLQFGLGEVLDDDQLAELQSMVSPRRRGGDRGARVERFMELDADGDGQLQRSEVEDRMPPQLFDRLDENGDGVIDKAELEAARERAGRGGGRRGGDAF